MSAPIYTFTPVITDDGKAIVHVDLKACGKVFENVAQIYEPDSSNPLLFCSRPLGFGAVQHILNHFIAARRAWKVDLN